MKIHKLNWLKPWINQGTEYVINTVLDDDDLLFDGYTQYIFDYLAQQKQIEPITFFACSKEMSWDFFATKHSPFGSLKNKNKHNFPPGAGLAVCCKYPEINFSIMSFEHTVFDYLSTDCEGFQDLTPKRQTRIENLRKMVFEEIDKAKIEWEGRLTAKNFHYVTTENTQVITINHFDNIQFGRLFSDIETRKPVNPNEFVPGFFVDFNLVEKHLSKYHKSFWLLLWLFKSNFKITPNFLLKSSQAKVFMHQVLQLKKIIAGYRNLN